MKSCCQAWCVKFENNPFPMLFDSRKLMGKTLEDMGYSYFGTATSDYSTDRYRYRCIEILDHNKSTAIVSSAELFCSYPTYSDFAKLKHENKQLRSANRKLHERINVMKESLRQVDFVLNILNGGGGKRA